MRAGPFHFFDKICQHFESQFSISNRNPRANHIPISTISFKILLQLQSHTQIFVQNPEANEGLTFPFLSQIKSTGAALVAFVKMPKCSPVFVGHPWANQTPISTFSVRHFCTHPSANATPWSIFLQRNTDRMNPQISMLVKHPRANETYASTCLSRHIALLESQISIFVQHLWANKAYNINMFVAKLWVS